MRPLPWTLVSRTEWGAGHNLPAGRAPAWPPAFHPIRKVVLHHTATACDDPDPMATVRALHRYHALQRGWGDLGYNLLVDASGTVYEGRASGPSGPPGQGPDGRGVTGAHVVGRNAGTVGIALLGSFHDRPPTPAALQTTADLVAALAGARGIDPEGADDYVNPVSGEPARFANLSAHRAHADTSCPGDALVAELGGLRRAAAQRISSGAR